tara:strand:+ start:50013 stop:51170 length:1158 start_codon:yes stop_codon:yes gene_type:complete
MKPKLIRITTVPISLEKLLEGQLSFMNQYFEVTAISSDKDRLEKFGKKERVSTFYIPLTRKITPFKDLLAIWKLYKHLVKEKPQIVHSHTPKAGIIAMLASYFANVPNRLHTVAGLPLMEHTGLKRQLLIVVEKTTYKLATQVYTNSDGLRDFIIKEKYIKASTIIGNGSSNGIDTNYFSLNHFSEVQLIEKRKELQISETEFVFIFVGRIVGDKGINELVEAFVKLQNSSLPSSNFSLLLVGPFEDELDPLTNKTKEAILNNQKIITTGYQEDVRIYFAISNVLVFPSYREGFPNVVMQAGAMELPCIVTNINGCNEIIENNVNGLIVSSKSIDELYKVMKLILNNVVLQRRLSSPSRNMIMDRFERKEFWSLLLKEYNNLISK